MEILDPAHLPERFDDVEALEEFMARPTQAVVDDLNAIDGDILVLGVGGKMGPTLARLAKRAAPDKRVVGVARFSEPGLKERLEGWGVETIACDLLDRQAVAELPRAKNVIFMAGRKFGSSGSEELTWAMNAYVPGIVAETFTESRIVAFSTACVYAYASVTGQGSVEGEPLTPPGEYANSCVGRERLFEHFSGLHGTPGRIVRLSYAIDMRYGVLFDVASKVYSGEPIDVTMGHANVIWQGDANAQVLRLLRHCTVPTSPINVSGPEVMSIRALARGFGELFGRAPVLTGGEAPEAWLVNTRQAADLFGYPVVPLARMMAWTADWVARGGASLGKPTHFEVRDGTY